jgi:hypothetical protein
MGVQTDVAMQQMRAFPKTGQRRGVDLMPSRPQQRRKPFPTPTTVAATMNQNEGPALAGTHDFTSWRAVDERAPDRGADDSTLSPWLRRVRKSELVHESTNTVVP